MSWACNSRSAFSASLARRTASRAIDTANSDCQLLGCPAYKLKPRMSDQNFSKVWCSSSVFIDLCVFDWFKIGIARHNYLLHLRAGVARPENVDHGMATLKAITLGTRPDCILESRATITAFLYGSR